MLKRILILSLTLLLCLGCVSCGNKGDAPDGMKAAHIEGEPFLLYVPDNWTLNEGSGISGAFYYGPELITVTARYYTPSRSMTVAEYLTECAAGYALTLTDFVTVSIAPDVLGGADAQRLTFTMSIDGKPYTGYQIGCLYEGDMVSLQIYLPTDSLQVYETALSDITQSFTLRAKAAPKNDEITDKKTPEGMKIASHDKLEYRLYVPKSWITDTASKNTLAYYPESGSPNVTLTSYSPADVMSAAEHWAACREEYQKSLSGFALLSETNSSVANKDAVDVTYTATVDGVTFRLRQVFFVYREMIYTLTYTALPDRFDLYAADVDRMLSEFHFR